jgi:4-hydroxy-4-methyl-2-oxoglutarate aldolase
MVDPRAFEEFSPTALADVLTREQVLHMGIRPVWCGMPRISGTAYPVRCAPADSLMLHAAIYRAPTRSVIVVEAGDSDYAVAGGNVCAIAQQRGIAGFIIDGAVRDVAEIRASGFPVFARGVTPIAAGKKGIGSLNVTIRCGGVSVTPGDVIVADEEGIVVVPGARLPQILESARARAAQASAETLQAWETSHRLRVEKALRESGFEE